MNVKLVRRRITKSFPYHEVYDIYVGIPRLFLPFIVKWHLDEIGLSEKEAKKELVNLINTNSKMKLKVQSNDIKWRKRSEKGYDGEMGMCQMQGVGYVVYTETHYIPWEELEKLPKEESLK